MSKSALSYAHKMFITLAPGTVGSSLMMLKNFSVA
jgi:hypothetical protein